MSPGLLTRIGECNAGDRRRISESVAVLPKDLCILGERRGSRSSPKECKFAGEKQKRPEKVIWKL